MMMMDVACATYEVDFIEERSIRYSREPVWLLGCRYHPQEGNIPCLVNIQLATYCMMNYVYQIVIFHHRFR